MARKFKITCDMNEDQIEKDVSAYVGFVNGVIGSRFRLESTDEPHTGADAKVIKGGELFYIQYKSPVGLESTSRVPLTAKKANEEYQKIRRFRKEKNLREDPYSLCFKLRQPQKPGDPLQHNVLFGYEKPPTSRAFYVAPTILNAEEYTNQLQDRRPVELYRELFYFRDYQAVHRPNFVRLMLQKIPFLRGHISIVPHQIVQSHEHFYSYSKYANDVAYHSPEVLDSGAERLSDFLAKELSQLYVSTEHLRPLDVLLASAFEMAPDDIKEELGRPGLDDQYRWLRSHGRILRQRYGISQYFLADFGEIEGR